MDVTALSWSGLNCALQGCKDIATLQAWLTEMMRTGRMTRALRVYGRLSAVRRAEELAAIKITVERCRRKEAE